MDDFEITVDEGEHEPAPVFELPTTERARVRQALREHFGEQQSIEPWLVRWIGSYTSFADYVASELEEILPPCAGWLAAYVDAEALIRDWTDCCRLVVVPDSRGMIHVFGWLNSQNLDPGAKRDSPVIRGPE